MKREVVIGKVEPELRIPESIDIWSPLFLYLSKVRIGSSGGEGREGKGVDGMEVLECHNHKGMYRLGQVR